MFNLALETIDETLSESLIKRLHTALKQGVFEDRANGYPVGEYKSRMNTVWDIETVSPDQVQEKMFELLVDYSKSKKNLSDIVKLHVEYEKIHPFQDGNGRTGRVILFRECIKNALIPFIIQDINKDEYTHLLNAAQKTGAIIGLEKYFVEEEKEYYKILKKFLWEYKK